MAYNVTVVVTSVVFAATTMYAAWFWRAPREPLAWILFYTLIAPSILAWWWLLRRSGMTLTRATIIYDLAVILSWYLPLLIWKEEGTTILQQVGLLLVLFGSILVACA